MPVCFGSGQNRSWAFLFFWVPHTRCPVPIFPPPPHTCPLFAPSLAPHFRPTSSHATPLTTEEQTGPLLTVLFRCWLLLLLLPPPLPPHHPVTPCWSNAHAHTTPTYCWLLASAASPHRHLLLLPANPKKGPSTAAWCCHCCCPRQKERPRTDSSAALPLPLTSPPLLSLIHPTNPTHHTPPKATPLTSPKNTRCLVAKGLDHADGWPQTHTPQPPPPESNHSTAKFQ